MIWNQGFITRQRACLVVEPPRLVRGRPCLLRGRLAQSTLVRSLGEPFRPLVIVETRNVRSRIAGDGWFQERYLIGWLRRLFDAPRLRSP